MAGLLTPLSFSGLTLRNRIVMPPMWSGQAARDGAVTPAIVEYHRVRAAAGCALVIVEHSFVHPHGRHSATQLGAWSDHLVDGLTRLAAAIKSEGAVACLQISHAGSRSTPGLFDRPPLAPSAVRHPYEPTGAVPAAMKPEEIREVVRAFGSAAVRARAAGFDAVEIHAAHGFLLSQFLSPLTNHRDDGYGGDEEGRRRLHLEVVAEVRKAIGPDAPVLIRLGAADETPGGLELAAAARAAVALVEHGVDFLDISGGLQGSRGEGRAPGYFVPYADAIKRVVPVPVHVTGGIIDPAHADRIIREGHADTVGIGRAMLNDAEWARKAILALGQASAT